MHTTTPWLKYFMIKGIWFRVRVHSQELDEACEVHELILD